MSPSDLLDYSKGPQVTITYMAEGHAQHETVEPADNIDRPEGRNKFRDGP